jgi:hypothetical protein
MREIKRFGLKWTTAKYRKFLDMFFTALGSDSYPLRYLTERKILYLKFRHIQAVYNMYEKKLYKNIQNKGNKS